MRLDPSRALAGAILKIDETTLAIKAEGGRIRARAQGWDEARALGADEVLEIVAVGNQLYFFARPRPLAYKNLALPLHCNPDAVAPL
jgi:hypothetical protein